MQIQGTSTDQGLTLESIDRARTNGLDRLLEAAKSGQANARDAAAVESEEEAGAAFEKYFNTMLVKEMRRSLPDGLFSGAGSDVYTAWFDEHVGEALTSRDTLGIAGLIKSSLARNAAAEEAGLDAASLELGRDQDKDEDYR
jgi:flagellar protein FlgJ